MADNVTTQSATPATLPASTIIASVQASFSGDTVHAGVGVLATSSGSEGSRTLDLLTSTAGALDVNIAGDTTLAQVGLSAAATFTPAASSHVANDCNGAAQQFSLGAVSDGRIMITDATLMISGATAEATAWRLYLYNVTPPSATADDGAWDLPSGDRASFLGYVDLGTAVDLGSTQWVQTSAINMSVKLADQSVFGYLVNLTTVTPANIAHIVTLTAVQL